MIASSSSSLKRRMAEKALARISPWLRCEPKMWSSGVRRKGHAHGGRLLPDGQVSGAGVVVGDAPVGALDLDLVEDGLELADGAHVAPDVQEVFGRVARAAPL